MFRNLRLTVHINFAVLVSALVVPGSVLAQARRHFEATAGVFAGQSNFGFDYRDWHKLLALRSSQSLSFVELEESIVHVFGCGGSPCTWDPATYVSLGLHLSLPVTTALRPYAGISIGGSSRPGIASFTRSWDAGARYVFKSNFGIQLDIRRRREKVFDDFSNPFNSSSEISVGFIKRL
jgi:hypothetical protein